MNKQKSYRGGSALFDRTFHLCEWALLAQRSFYKYNSKEQSSGYKDVQLSAHAKYYLSTHKRNTQLQNI